MKSAILARIDARITIEDFLGLRTGDAYIIRNVGEIVIEEAPRALIISYKLDQRGQARRKLRSYC